MALPKFALGREEKIYAVPETTYGAAASAAAAGNALKFKECAFNKTEDRVYREDKRATRSFQETIVRRVNSDWSVKGYLLPSGAAGTAPDGWDDLLEYALGTETIVPATSVAYTLAKEFEKSLTIHRAVGNSLADAVFSEMYLGCVANVVQFQLSGQDETMISISGFAADMLRAGTGTIDTDDGTTITFDNAGEAHEFDTGAYVDADSEAGLLISDVDTGANTIDVASHTGQANGERVGPSACVLGQTFVSTAVPVSGILGSCTLEGSSLDIISAEINIDNGAQPHNDKYGSNKTTSFHRGNRTVTGSISLRLNETNFQTVAKSRRSSTVALVLVSGTAAGSIATFSLPTVIVDFSPIPAVPVDDIIVNLPFKAYATSSGEDEFSLTLT